MIFTTYVGKELPYKHILAYDGKEFPHMLLNKILTYVTYFSCELYIYVI